VLSWKIEVEVVLLPKPECAGLVQRVAGYTEGGSSSPHAISMWSRNSLAGRLTCVVGTLDMAALEHMPYF